MRLCLICILLIVSLFDVNAQVQESNLYGAGFQTLTIVDSSRIYKSNTSTNDRLHFRPLDLDIWYPSADVGSNRIHFRDLFKLFEERANKYSGKTTFTGMTEELALFFAAEAGLNPEDGKRLLNIKTDSYKNLSPLKEKKPLILYMAGLNGMGFENFKLLENLAKNGYVIVAISSIGRYPGDMTNNIADMMEQVCDAESAIEVLRNQNKINIDFNRIGVIGYSWGGLSAAVLTTRNPTVKTLISFDGSEIDYFGRDEEENKNSEEIYNPGKKRISYFYLGTGSNLTDSVPSDKYNYFHKSEGNKYYLRFVNSRHEDLSCIPYILKSSKISTDTYDAIMRSSLLFLNASLKGQNTFDPYFKELAQSRSVTTQPFQLNQALTTNKFVKGMVTDNATGQPLPFVNIAVLNTNIGTVTNDSGEFKLKLDTNLHDTIRISMVGYKAKLMKAGELFSQKNISYIKLEKTNKELNEVVISVKKLRSKIIGNKTTSKFLSTGFSPDQLGAEIGIKINIPGRPTCVDAFSFHISYNRLKSRSLFRLNIYNIKNGKPSENILRESITIPVEGEQTGIVSMNLKPYHIILDDDVIVTLELIKNEKEPKDGEAIFFSLGLLTNGTFVKTSNHAKMKKHSNLGVGFNMNVRY